MSRGRLSGPLANVAIPARTAVILENIATPLMGLRPVHADFHCVSINLAAAYDRGIEQLVHGPTCPIEKDIPMTSATTFRTPYNDRVDLISHTIVANSALDSAAATDLAVHILRALQSIPEKAR
ncbi:DUF6307 family protein [Mycolicibacterium bacteremicum]|uniref:DUF6307 family protein n=1 Tax=Mycolicibacterium bacteremicum TaxID=564198 RepID=UPI0038B2E267